MDPTNCHQSANQRNILSHGIQPLMMDSQDFAASDRAPGVDDASRLIRASGNSVRHPAISPVADFKATGDLEVLIDLAVRDARETDAEVDVSVAPIMSRIPPPTSPAHTLRCHPRPVFRRWSFRCRCIGRRHPAR